MKDIPCKTCLVMIMCKERLKLHMGYYAGWAILRDSCDVMRKFIIDQSKIYQNKEVDEIHMIEDQLISLYGKVYMPSCTYPYDKEKLNDE
ncbi:MAG: hypothetical protein ACFFG0_03930 [Candidatus Thorarchaeota archaeon]